MHPVTLSFRGELEHDFLSYYNKKTTKQIRYALFICFLFSWLYMIVDGQLFPSVKSTEVILTNYILIPSILAVYILTYFPPALCYIQAFTSGVVVIRSMGTICIMALDPMIADSYFTGLLLGLVFGFSVCRLRFIYANIVSLIVISMYFLACVWPILGSPLPTPIMNHCVDLTMFVILGVFTTYFLEQYARRDFLQNLIIEHERQIAADTKLALEKERVSRELHDGISSEFTGILAFAENIKIEVEQNSCCDNLVEVVGKIENSARRGLQELRNIMLAIDPETKALGYTVAYIKRFSHDLLSSQGITVEVSEDLRSADIVLPPQIILALFRITQEACHNILKHARADIVKLAFSYEDCWLEVEVTDNGRGFATDTVVYGNGISNMRKRAKKVDGEFTITSFPDTGTSILVRIPLS